MTKNNTYIFIGVILLIVLVVLTFLESKPPFWDEAYYLENITNLNNTGFSKQYLIDYKGPAGPTYALIHYLLQPITKLAVPFVRFVNIIFLFGVLMYLKKIFDAIENTKQNSLVFTISSLSIATIYTIAGLVLTEIFAVFFMTFTVYYLVKHYKENKNNYFIAIVAGLSFSLSILARQPMIVLWLALPFLFLKHGSFVKFDFEKKEFFKFILITVCTSLILPCYIFYVWGGLTPFSQASVGDGLSPINLVLALSYAAIFTVFIKPNYFKIIDSKTNRYEFLTVTVISVLLNILFLKIEFSPFNSIISNWLSPSFIPYYKMGCGSLLGIVGLSFIYYFLKKNLKEKDPLTLFFAFGFLLIIGTSLKVTHQFSARYVAQAFPIIVFALHAKGEKINWLSVVTLAVGGSLGIASLQSYFLN